MWVGSSGERTTIAGTDQGGRGADCSVIGTSRLPDMSGLGGP